MALRSHDQIPDFSLVQPTPHTWTHGLGLVNSDSWTGTCGLRLVDSDLWTGTRGRGLVDSDTCTCTHGLVLVESDLWTQTCGSSLRGALKTRKCSGLDAWIVPASALKNEELFRIELVDRPHVEPLKQGGVLDWTCGLSLRGAFTIRRCSRLDL